MIKVVHLITKLEFGGAQGNTLYTVAHLDPLKYDVHLWAGNGAYWDKSVQNNPQLAKKILFFNFLVRPLNPLFDLLCLISLYRAFRVHRPVIVHTHSSKAGILGRMAAHFARIPTIIHTYHGFGFNHEQKPWTRWLFISLERWMATYSTALIFVSKANQEEATDLRIGTPAQYHLIRSGVPLKQLSNLSHDKELLSNEFNIPTTAKVVTTISAFKPQKNLNDFISMAKEVVKIRSDTHFLLIGDGEERLKIRQLIKFNQLEDKIHLTGWREDADRLLAASDVFVLTSLWEGLPRALLEALYMGKPSVCYQTDGVRDVLEDGGGYIVPQKNFLLLSQKVIALLNNENHYSELSREAKSRVTSDFDIDYMVQQQDQLYVQLKHT